MKKKTIERRTLDSTIAGVFSFSLTFIQSILLVPLFLNYWGTEKYGIWISLLAFFAIFQTLDLGHQNYVGNEFNKYFHVNKEKAKEVLGSSLMIAYLLALIEFAILFGLISLNIIPQILNINQSGFSILEVELSLVALMFVWMLTGSFGGILVRIILPIGLYSRSIYLSLTIKLAQISVLFFATILNLTILNTALLYSSVSFLYNIYLYLYIRRVLPEFFPWWNTRNIRYGFANLFRSSAFTTSAILDQFKNNGIILIISSILSASVVPIFTTIRTLPNMALQVNGLILNPLYPEMIRYHSKREFDKLTQTFFTTWFITGSIINLILILIIPFIEKFYQWWTGGILIFEYSLFLLLSFSVSLLVFGEVLNMYLRSINKLTAILIISVVRFISFIGISFLTLPNIGLLGIGIASVVSELLCSVLIPILITKNEIKKYSFNFRLITILINIVPLLIVAVVYTTVSFFPFQNISIVLTGIISILLITYFQWKGLNTEVKLRIKSVLIRG